MSTTIAVNTSVTHTLAGGKTRSSQVKGTLTTVDRAAARDQLVLVTIDGIGTSQQALKSKNTARSSSSNSSGSTVIGVADRRSVDSAEAHAAGVRIDANRHGRRGSRRRTDMLSEAVKRDRASPVAFQAGRRTNSGPANRMAASIRRSIIGNLIIIAYRRAVVSAEPRQTRDARNAAALAMFKLAAGGDVQARLRRLARRPGPRQRFKQLAPTTMGITLTRVIIIAGPSLLPSLGGAGTGGYRHR